jgi:acyl CoA:acetate/3-ketoacid CoA transferase
LQLGGTINLGIGMREEVAAVAAEERVIDHLTLTAESGVIGGTPQGGLNFGAGSTTRCCTRISSSTSTTVADSISRAWEWPKSIVQVM